jgi:hypothetical protein
MTSYASPSPTSGQTNNLSIASLVSAAVAWIIGGLGSCAFLLSFPPFAVCTWVVFLVGSIVAAVTGHMGRSQIRQSGGAQTGEGMAMAGLVLGWAGVALNVLPICLAPVFIAILALMGPTIGNVFSDVILTITAQP